MMRNSKIPVMLGSLLIVCIIFTQGMAIAGDDISKEIEKEFELKNGDRVVLLGNSLIQNDQQYGYIEYALTTRWPDRDITFRNLGWSGDTVFGEARSYFTTPPDAYELLIKQLTEAQPTVVFIGYGSNEAFEGEHGVSRFREGLNKLLDEIEKMGAQAILLSPVPQMSVKNVTENLSVRNKNLKLYTSVISKAASERNLRFINLFKPFKKINKNVTLTMDGVHLNENGYYYLATVIEDELGLPSRKWEVEIDLSEQVLDTSGAATILESQFSNNSVKFTLDAAILPLPPPGSDTRLNVHPRTFKISGLDKGCYTLSAGISDVASASAEKWSAGVDIKQGVLFRQANELQNLIIEKNRLFFRKYRPTNRIYLVGFRTYEQGENSKELEQLDLFIARLEDQISQLRKPRPDDYRINGVK